MKTTAEIFEETANKIIAKKKEKENDKKKIVIPNYDKRKCEDQFLGLIQIERGNAHFCRWITVSEKHDDIDQRKKIHEELENLNYPVLVIVLESPHTNEFKYAFPTLALGETGENLVKLLPKYINRIDCTIEDSISSKGSGYLDMQSGIYRVLLVNAIQYQCSLGVSTKLYRTDVFNELWNKDEFKKDFTTRMLKHDVKIVVNASTSSVRNNVQECIDLLGKIDIVKFHSYHPSQWQYCLGIEAEGWQP